MKKIHDFKEIVIDTGPLLLFLAGVYKHNTLEKFGYDEEDFRIMMELLKGRKIFVTPQVLAEVSNLAKKRIKEDSFLDFINSSKKILCMLKERYVEKDTILTKEELQLPKFGFTDASLIEVAMNNKLLLTGDYKLHDYCKNKKIPSISLAAIKTYPSNLIFIDD